MRDLNIQEKNCFKSAGVLPEVSLCFLPLTSRSWFINPKSLRILSDVRRASPSASASVSISVSIFSFAPLPSFENELMLKKWI